MKSPCWGLFLGRKFILRGNTTENGPVFNAETGVFLLKKKVDSSL